MIAYQKNNIVFRIASADAIGKFKTAQACSFLQLTRKELDFYEATRETVLLEYDKLSSLILKIERMCLAAGEGKITKQLNNSIFAALCAEIDEIENIMECNTSIFTQEVIDFTKLIHKYSLENIKERFDIIISHRANIDNAFSSIVHDISDYLQHLLIALHEFNINIMKKVKKPVICISSFSVNMGGYFYACTQRLNFYKKAGLGTNFVFKNYSNHNIFETAKQHLEQLGITLFPEEVIADSI